MSELDVMTVQSKARLLEIGANFDGLGRSDRPLRRLRTCLPFHLLAKRDDPLIECDCVLKARDGLNFILDVAPELLREGRFFRANDLLLNP